MPVAVSVAMIYSLRLSKSLKKLIGNGITSRPSASPSARKGCSSSAAGIAALKKSASCTGVV
jgi:hypothetical protein